jgi:hypothetical protein
LRLFALAGYFRHTAGLFYRLETPILLQAILAGETEAQQRKETP